MDFFQNGRRLDDTVSDDDLFAAMDHVTGDRGFISRGALLAALAARVDVVEKTSYPYGMISDESFSGWTKLAGGGDSTLTASPVSGFAARATTNGVPVNELFLSCAATMGDPLSSAAIQTQVNNAITRGHDVHILAHLGGAVTPDQNELNATLAWLGGLHRSGAISVVPFDLYESIK